MEHLFHLSDLEFEFSDALKLQLQSYLLDQSFTLTGYKTQATDMKVRQNRSELGLANILIGWWALPLEIPRDETTSYL